MKRIVLAAVAALAFADMATAAPVEPPRYHVNYTVTVDFCTKQYYVWGQTDAPGGICSIQIEVYGEREIWLNDDQQLQLPVFRRWVTDAADPDTGEPIPPHWEYDRGFYVHRLDSDEGDVDQHGVKVSSTVYMPGYNLGRKCTAGQSAATERAEIKLCRYIGAQARTYNFPGYPSQKTSVPVLMVTGSYTGTYGWLYVTGVVNVFNSTTGFDVSAAQPVGGQSMWWLPEPASIGLLLAGMPLVLRRRRSVSPRNAWMERA